MSEKSTETLLTTPQERKSGIIQTNGDENQIKAQVTMALSALDSRYKENIAAYAQELHDYTHQIDTTRINLDLLIKQKVPHRKMLEAVEKEIDHEIRMLTYFTEQWVQKCMIVAALENEVKQWDHSRMNDRLFFSKKEELTQLNIEIEALELSLLKHELEKQNLLLKIEPLEHKIYALEKTMQELESRKRYIESSYLHRITQVAPVAQPQLAAKTVKKESL